MKPPSAVVSHPLFRTLCFVIIMVLSLQALRVQWRRVGSDRKDFSSVAKISSAPIRPKLAVAHFMLGNTYPYTSDDWEDTFSLAQDTGLDALALNLGPNEWQLSQAKQAYNILTTLPQTSRPLKLFLSLDMQVLPSSTISDYEHLASIVSEFASHESQLYWGGRPLLSTFGGHQSSFGGQGWNGFLSNVNQNLNSPIFFMPAFFIPPEDFINLHFVDGMFAWNNAWQLKNRPVSLDEDRPFLKSSKPYMASVSPLFFTHYGKEGDWAFDKNWIYPSDNLSFPTRWDQLINLEEKDQPEIIQIISWNDYGESHAIAPVLGGQPGSETWTDEMDHEGFREMSRYYIGRWRDGKGEVEFPALDSESVGDQVVVFMWYRTHPAEMEASDDPIGKPEHSEWAQDLINFLILLPPSETSHQIRVHTGKSTRTKYELTNGQANMLTSPFQPGPVKFEITRDGGSWKSEDVLRGVGKEIRGEAEKYNYNMWSGVWRGKI